MLCGAFRGMIAAVQTLGDRIQIALDAKDWRPNRLASAIDVDTDTVRRWVKGLNKPRVDDVPDVAQALGVSVAWLLTGEDQPFDDETVVAIYEGIEPLERLAMRNLKKPRLSSAERVETEEALAGADAMRRMLGLGRSKELDDAVLARLSELHAMREAAIARAADVADPAAASRAAEASDPEIAAAAEAARRARALAPDPDEKASRQQGEDPRERPRSA